MKIKDFMIKEPVIMKKNITLEEAVYILTKYKIFSAPVVDGENKVVGIFTRDIILNTVKEKISTSTKIDKLLIKNYNVINESEDANVIMNMPAEIFIVVNNDNEFVGLLRRKHLFKGYFDKLEYAFTNLHAILDFTSNAIISIDLEGKIILFNNSAKEILEIDKTKKVIGKSILEFVPNSKLMEVINNDERQINEIFISNKRKFLVNRCPVKNKGQIVGAISIFQDITSYSKIEDELKSEKNEVEILNTILEIAYDGIIVVDVDGFITMISNAYRRFLGVEEEDIVGKHVTEIIENTRLHIVAKTGIPEVADLQKIDGNYIIASRIPVYKDGVVKSVVGKVVFRNINELDNLYIKINKIEQELKDYKDELSKINKAKYNFESIEGESTCIKETKALARKVARTDSNVLITGESGTGKELFAHAIHSASQRRSRPFVKVNCAAIPDELLESELFGYDAGAFTGAKKSGKMGKFEVADRGTIFLDEIGDMPLHMQAKLLRVLQEKEIERIGSNKPKEIDVRIVVATNRNLEEMVENKKFRLDLYYRLNVVTLNIPSLRERKEDIKILAKNFVEKFRLKYYKKIDGISEKSIKKLTRYDWPGNIRELENIIERAINIIETDNKIQPKHLPIDIIGKIDIEETKSLRELMEEAEKKVLEDYLEFVGNNKSKAAKLLRISRTALYEKIDKYGIK